MDRTLAGAFIDNGVVHRVFGVRLRRFSVWHKFLLLAAESPFTLGTEVTLFDLREAVGICRLGARRSKVRRPWLWPTLACCRYGWRSERWMKYLKARRDDLLSYMGDYITEPEYAVVPPRMPTGKQFDVFPQTPRGAIPEIFTLVADVVEFLRCDPDYVWEMPMGEARWWQLAARRARGDDIDFLTEDEREFQHQMKLEELRTGSRVDSGAKSHGGAG